MLVSKKYSKVILAAVFLLFAMFTASHFVLAAAPEVGLNYAAGTGLSASEDIRVIIAKIIRIALGFLGIIAVGLIMYAGWLWMSSEGNEEKIEQAKKILKNAIIGLIIILSSFAIVSFILNQLTGSGGGGGGGNFRSGGGASYGLSAIENGAIASVYPARGQLDVPRNTSIIITFRQAVKPDGLIKDGKMNSDSIKIYKTSDSASLVTDVAAVTKDSLTFVFTPAQYLGSPSEKIWYTVSLTLDNIKKQSDGKKITNPWSSWNFEVSDKLDLIPPQVLKGGVAPAADVDRDSVDVANSTPAKQARGVIEIKADPAVYSDAAVVKAEAGGVSGQVSASVNKNCANGGDFTAEIDQNNTGKLLSGNVLLGQGAISNKTISFNNCGLKLTLAQGIFSAGNSWAVTIKAMTAADTVTVGSLTYTAGASENQSTFKVIAGDKNATAKSLADVINKNNSDVTAEADNGKITITAKLAGLDGNSISPASSDKNRIAITEMKNGTDKKEVVIFNGVPDVARNAVIRIDFNEAVNPLTVSGDSRDVENYIRVKNLTDNSIVAGNFKISNQYKTVEFVSSLECGVNACGEKIYCLPENSQLKVEFKAAALASCGTDGCASRSPFNSCNNGSCQDAKGNKYPLSGLPLNGAADLANNSLDGNRDGQAAGPISYYNENAPDAKQGDNFTWSFFTNDKIDLTPPEIDSVSPSQSGARLTEPVIIIFKKLMMSSSLMTGETVINNGQENITHKLINLWNFANQPLGYWITNENIDVSPLDGVFDRTKVYINHTGLADATSYRAQAGSGVKDLYQNCYKPSQGPGCAGVNEDNPSCCLGTATADLLPQGNCQ